MNLVIRAVMLDEQPLEEPLLGIFDARGGTIGRSEANTLALPDPERRLSRLQAEVSSGAQGYVIRNAGSTTTILLNERSLSPGESGRLAHRDELRLGGYVLRVLLEDATAGAGAAPAHVAVDARAAGGDGMADARTDPRFMAPRPAAGRATADALNPFADLVSVSPGTSGAASDPLGDPFAFLGTEPSAARPTASPAPPRAVLPDDFDPFADLAEPPRAAPPSAGAAGSRGSGAPVDLLGSVGAGSGRVVGLDEAFGLSGSGGGSGDALAAFMAGGASPSGRSGTAATSGPSTDPLAMFAAPAPPAAAAPARPAAAFNHTAELQAAYTPPRIVELPRPAPPPPVPAASASSAAARAATAAPLPRPPAQPAHAQQPPPPQPGVQPTRPVPAFSSQAAADTAALWSAFCAGAGVTLPMPHGLTAEHMHLLGQLLRSSIDGTRRLLAQRDGERRAVRAGTAPAGPRDHNPLLFAADTQVALERLLLPPARGFMAGPAAMQGALQELAEHGMASAAGSRAGLVAALAQFEPQQLETALADKGLLALNRKAKVWEQYQQRYEALRKEAQERFRAQLARSLGDPGGQPTRP